MKPFRFQQPISLIWTTSGMFIDILLTKTTVRRKPNIFVASKILLSSLLIHCVIATYYTHLVLFFIDFFS